MKTTLPTSKMLRLMLFLAMAVFSVAAPRESRAENEGIAATGHDEPALLMVFNRPILVMRAHVMGYSPSERVKATGKRIEKLIDQKIYGPVTTAVRKEGTVILVGGQIAFAVHPGDVDELSERTYDETVQDTVQLLDAALGEARLQHSTPRLVRSAVKAVIATGVFLILAWLLSRLYGRTIQPIIRLAKRFEDRLAARGLFFLAQLMRGARPLARLCFCFVFLALAIEWATLCLTWFPYTEPWGEALQSNLYQLAGGVLGSFLLALPNLGVIALIIVLTRMVLGLIKGFFSGVESGRVKLDWLTVEAARATRRILTVIIWLFALVMIYPHIPGSDSGAFKGISVFVGLLFSLGSTSVVGQFTSGLVLMYSHALRPGEYVLIGELEGTVESLGFLSTKIRSLRNEEFHVPNLVILGTTVKNYSRLAGKGGLLLNTSVTIGYDVPWRQVHALLIRAAKNTPGLASASEPFVLQMALSDYYVEYQVFARAENPQDRFAVLAALHANIQDQFNTYGVQIMSPHYVTDPNRPAIVPREKWYAAPAAPEGSSPGGLPVL